MAIVKVSVEDGCTACGLCEETAPDVFEVNDTAHVKEGADLDLNEELIKQAAEECPVEVIKVEEA